ncbi:GDYXXLXY domain-containing protein [Effusibacillus consociatus]|uniref:GDYXXLXY domain-containing protein n=1 Tax=Effusibacillus consociatus TaxID=1117041 RepID=A0ABV9Q3X5_9BACL
MRKKLTILVLLQCLVLLFIAGQHYTVAWFGKEILLKTVPIDPRDPFRGDFAQLGYEISQIPAPNEDVECKRGCQVFVLLEKQGEFYAYQDASFTDKFAPADNQVVIKGKTYYSPREAEGKLHVTYGIEQVFVQEGHGKPLEDRDATVTVAVKVLNGKAVLQRVYLNGQLYR